MNEVFKALADPHRRQILDLLNADNGQTLGQLCAGADISRQGFSKHIAILERANLVVTKFRGREKYHYINPYPIQEIADRWISRFSASHLSAIAALKQAVERK